MFGYFQPRRRPLVDKSSISKDIIQRAAQNRNRLGVVGLACGHARLLYADYYDKVTTQTKRLTRGGHARKPAPRRWLTIAIGPILGRPAVRPTVPPSRRPRTVSHRPAKGRTAGIMLMPEGMTRRVFAGL